MAEHLNYGEDGKYYVVFYLLSTIYAYTPDDTSNFEEMAKDLLKSSVKQMYSDSYLNKAKKCFENGEMEKMIKRFFKGATEANGYTPDEPLTLTMREDAYSAQHSRIGDKDIYIETIYLQIPETGEEVGVLVYQDPLDGYWHLYSGYDKLLKDAE